MMNDKARTIALHRRSIDALHYEQLISEGFDPIVARVVAGRPLQPTQEGFQKALAPSLASLDTPHSLADIGLAVQRIVTALENKEVIGLETDHDCDGQTSHAVLYTAFTQFFGHPKSKVQSYIGHRLNEDYGLSDKLCNRILAASEQPTLIITADNGSADELRIKRLLQEGIDTIVTDHHEIPIGGIPASAFAVLNPTRDDCQYNDPCIAGCMVAWLLVAAVRQALLDKGYLKDKKEAPIEQLLDFVAVGTVADCVSIARSINNRAVVRYGLRLIEQGARPCWRALTPQLSTPVSVEDLGFKIGPLLNSDGRLDSAHGAVSFLLAEDANEAQAWIVHLTDQNKQRKEIQKTITRKAMKSAQKQAGIGKLSICVFLEEGHPGVHGISASRVKDAFGLPTIILAPKVGETDLLTGSARSVNGLHIKKVLEHVQQKDSSLLVAFGGHQGAAGLTLKRNNLPAFIQAFESSVQHFRESFTPGPIVMTDGVLPSEYFEVDKMSALLSVLSPFGREFEAPTFEAAGTTISVQPVGDGTHLRLTFHIGNKAVEAMWFNAREDADEPINIGAGNKVHLAFSAQINTFRGVQRFNPHVLYCEMITEEEIQSLDDAVIS
jgi:single-stranded-DNA-specific exonuclease